MLLIALNFVDPINCIQNTNIRFEQHKIHLLMNATSRKPEPKSLFWWYYYLNNNSKEREERKKKKETKSVKIANILHLLFYHNIRSFPSFRSFRLCVRIYYYLSLHHTNETYRKWIIGTNVCLILHIYKIQAYNIIPNHTEPYNHMQNAHYGGIVHCVSHFRHINIFPVWIHNVFDCVYSVWNSYWIKMNEGQKKQWANL